jgi:hypothetical protein
VVAQVAVVVMTACPRPGHSPDLCGRVLIVHHRHHPSRGLAEVEVSPTVPLVNQTHRHHVLA